MLDQNTDRMWFVIGAVIVGAAIIFIANGSLPTLFASVTDTFTEVSDSALEVVDSIAFTQLLPSHIREYYSTLIDYDEDTGTFTFEVDPAEGRHVDAGVRIVSGAIVVPYGYRHTIAYEVYVPFDMMSVQDVNATPVEGSPWNVGADGSKWHLDNDDLESRRFNGQKAIAGVDHAEGYTAPVKKLPLKGGQWNSMTYTYTNTSPNNVNKISLHDTSSFGALLLDMEGDPFEIQIRNIRNIVEEVGE